VQPHRAPSTLRRALRLSFGDGVAYAFMVGAGETILVADALRLGGTRTELGLVVTLPLLVAGLGPLLALRILARLPSRRRLVSGAAFLQALNWIGLALLDLLGWNDPALLMAAAGLHHLLGQACAAGWSSWFGDLVPARVRGRVFGRRNAWVYLSTCVGMVVSGVLLETLEPAAGSASVAGRGFVCLYALSGLARLASALVLRVTPEPRFVGLTPPRRVLSFLATERGTRAVRLLVFSGVLHLMVYLAGPYFAPFMLDDLRLGYGGYMAASLALVVFKVVAVPRWGRVVDGRGSRATLVVSALLVALAPLPWLWTGGLGWALAAQAFSGVAWGGYDVALFSRLLDSSRSGTRPHVFALQTLMHGAGQLLGGMLGALLLVGLGDRFRLLFAVSLAARLMVLLAVPFLVPGDPREPRRRRGVVLRMAGWRPAGGVTVRPVSWPAGQPLDEATADRNVPSAGA
jgi:MFS family permease